MLKLFNTLTRKKEIFKPLKQGQGARGKGQIGLYTCGPTVYNYAHIGNLRTYIFEDILRRTLEQNGYKVKHVMNITDVGHLTSNADEGEDKLEKEAKKEKKSPWDIAKFYTNAFLRDLKNLNIKKAHTLSPATKNIKEQIEIIKKLFKNGYAYDTPEAVYFDVSKFKNYEKISRQNLKKIQIGARGEVITETQKRNPTDFALWFKRVGRFKDHIMHWPSLWGDGFPGWHIECSAISTKYLGQPFDIHTGGVDHIYPHHTNEIAQSEGANKKLLAKYWLHGEFLVIEGSRMGKSEGNFITLTDVVKKNFNPLAYRYFVLGAHYRSKLNFTWEALRASQNALEKLYEVVRMLKGQKSSPLPLVPIRSKFYSALYDDLNTPQALAVLWETVKLGNLSLLLEFDKVLGLGLKNIKPISIPHSIQKLAQKREEFRKQKKWREADEIREELKKKGYILEDAENGSKIFYQFQL